MMYIELGEITSTGDKFSIASILGDNGRPTEKRVFLPRDNMRMVTTRIFNPFIILGVRDHTQVTKGDRIAFVVDKRWDPGMGKYPTAFAWGLWEDPREAVETPPPAEPVVEPVSPTVAIPTPAPYSTPHSGGARRPSRRKRRNERLASVTTNGDKPESTEEVEETSQLVWSPGMDHHTVGLAEGAID
jgi:hypothetical protein